MTKNKSRLTPADTLKEMVESHERQLRELKSAQLLGADNLAVTSFQGAITDTIADGDLQSYQFYAVPAVTSPGLWTTALDVRVDTDTTAFSLHGGASLTPTLLSTDIYGPYGYIPLINDSTGQHAWEFVLFNYSGGSRTYYITFRAYALQTSGSVAQ